MNDLISNCCAKPIISGSCSACHEHCGNMCAFCEIEEGHRCCECDAELTEKECKEQEGLCDTCLFLVDK